ncbi:alpha-glucosidase [Elysia marginata]|uniref:Alpha-glucosidase n=1 Tax=Elysia marginata TaxID=1093978 RepID=A0AAV4J823_9GAST|nr:alpha-glucosidase [Elysia marginata]
MAVRKRVMVMVVSVFLMAGLMAGVGVYLWRQHEDRDTDAPAVTLPLGPEVNLYISKGGKSVSFSVNSVGAEGRYKELRSDLGISAQGRAQPCAGVDTGGKYICVQWEDGTKVYIVPAQETSKDLQCVTMSWNVSMKQPGTSQTPTDCYDMTHSSWYGAFEDHFQFWPMNGGIRMNSSAYVVGEIFEKIEYGEVIEPLFVSSLGLGIHVDIDSPLYLAINGMNSRGRLCLSGRIGKDTPYFTQTIPWLKYDLCRAKDISVLWKEMSKKYLPKPKLTPSEDLIRGPIWSTWARYKQYINQSKAIEFAEEILQNNMSISQLEIDDDWTPFYGDFDFNATKFPEPAAMVNELLEKGIHTTLWMHPYVNRDAENYEILAQKGYFVRDYTDNKQPASVNWWRGNDSGIIDFTNTEAVDWYLKQTRRLQADYNISSFKFDGGEATSLGKKYALAKNLSSPNYFTTHYVEAACRADMTERRQEVRVAFRSQECHTMVRMLDRSSDWSHELGLLTLIPTALAYGLAGYPFVLPDMIGGNAYNGSDIDQSVLPERELYIRWLQATLFMPTLQFSVAPWDYKKHPDTTSIVKKMLAIREKYVEDIIALMNQARDTGEPIVRPLWWTDPLDKEALRSESQFLLGNDLLVAPVLEKGQRKRDIYLPQGMWKDQVRGHIYQGKRWLRGFVAELDQVPYFTRAAKPGVVG